MSKKRYSVNGDGLEPLNEGKVDDEIKLKKNLTVWNGVSLIVGTIIGSGIFLTPRGVIDSSGSVGASIIVWVICGLISMLGAICYAELGTTIVRSGGDYAYILESFGPLPAFLQLWVNLIVIRPTAQAIVSMTFANYALQPFFPTCDPPVLAIRLLAAVCIAILIYVNVTSVRAATRIQDVFSLAKVLALISIIIAGIVLIFQGHTEHFEEPFADTTTDVGSMSLAVYSGLFAYAGWNFLNFVTEEMKDPQRDMPRAIYISIPIVTVIYVLVNISYFTAVSPIELKASNSVAVLFGNRVFGFMAWVVPVFVSLSCFGGVNGLLFTSGRLFFVGAIEGQLPAFFGMINVKRYTPLPALLFTGGFSMLMLMTDNVWVLINYMSFVQWLSVGASIAGMIYLRVTKPEMPRPIKFNLGIPIAFSVCVLFLLIMPLFAATSDTVMGLIIVLSGIPVYILGVAWKGKPKKFTDLVNSLTVTGQKILQVAPQH